MKKVIHAAIGILVNQNQQLYITKRPPEKEFDGLWEFPGGKLEIGETIEQALKREIAEEIGVDIINFKPLISYPYEFTTKIVTLSFFIVDKWQGTAQPRENQLGKWIYKHQLVDYVFLNGSSKVISLLLDQFNFNK